MVLAALALTGTYAFFGASLLGFLALVWAALGLWLGRDQNRRKGLQTT